MALREGGGCELQRLKKKQMRIWGTSIQAPGKTNIVITLIQPINIT